MRLVYLAFEPKCFQQLEESAPWLTQALSRTVQWSACVFPPPVGHQGRPLRCNCRRGCLRPLGPS